MNVSQAARITPQDGRSPGGTRASAEPHHEGKDKSGDSVLKAKCLVGTDQGGVSTVLERSVWPQGGG